MKKAEEFMNEFINTLNNMKKYQNVKINYYNPNYDEIEKAFTEEKNIVVTYEPEKEKPKLLEKR